MRKSIIKSARIIARIRTTTTHLPFVESLFCAATSFLCRIVSSLFATCQSPRVCRTVLQPHRRCTCFGLTIAAAKLNMRLRLPPAVSRAEGHCIDRPRVQPLGATAPPSTEASRSNGVTARSLSASSAVGRCATRQH